jgi:hypothetical protein
LFEQIDVPALHTFRAIARMLEDLGPPGKRAWDLLDVVDDGTLSLGKPYDGWRGDDLEGLRARRAEVDLRDHVASWQAWLQDRTTAETTQHYLAHLRTLMPDDRPYWRSQLTALAVARWLAGRTALTPKRRRAAKQSRRQPDPAPSESTWPPCNPSLAT